MNVKKHKCRKKPVQKELIENIVLNAAMDIFKDKALIRKISKACFDLQSKESPMLPALKRRLRENRNLKNSNPSMSSSKRTSPWKNSSSP